MKGHHLSRLITTLMRISRGGILAAAIGSAILATALSNGALAQETVAQERDQAPIGHRQPRPQDLPRSVVRQENRPNNPGYAFDKKLEDSICRGC
jgi:hypothetical protein